MNDHLIKPRQYKVRLAGEEEVKIKLMTTTSYGWWRKRQKEYQIENAIIAIGMLVLFCLAYWVGEIHPSYLLGIAINEIISVSEVTLALILLENHYHLNSSMWNKRRDVFDYLGIYVHSFYRLKSTRSFDRHIGVVVFLTSLVLSIDTMTTLLVFHQAPFAGKSAGAVFSLIFIWNCYIRLKNYQVKLSEAEVAASTTLELFAL